MVWSSKRFRKLSEPAKLLHLYLMTCGHQNSTGSFRAPLGYISADIDWPVDRISTALAELTASELIAHDPDEDEFFVRGWFRVNAPMNQKHGAGTLTLIGSIKSEAIGKIVLEEFEVAVAADATVAAAMANRSRMTETNYMRGGRRDR